MAQKVSAREVRSNEIAAAMRDGTYGLEQCLGCPAGGMFRPDPHDGMIDGCGSHSTANYYATSRDAQMGGGNL